MKKARLSVYLDPELMAQLTELADQKQKPKSLIAEAAIMSFLTPDDADRREAALARRLDLLTRQGERLERDLWVAAETLALFIRFRSACGWIAIARGESRALCCWSRPPAPHCSAWQKHLLGSCSRAQ